MQRVSHQYTQMYIVTYVNIYIYKYTLTFVNISIKMYEDIYQDF